MTHPLIRHPASVGGEGLRLTASVIRLPSAVELSFEAMGPIDTVRWPAPESSDRGDDLWRHTCFELFVRSGAGYQEFNFAPSGRWAAYAFSSYRERVSDLPTAAPFISCRSEPYRRVVDVVVQRTPSDSYPLRVGISAVIEDVGGGRSYWALAHPAERPDFHHPDSFVLELAPA